MIATKKARPSRKRWGVRWRSTAARGGSESFILLVFAWLEAFRRARGVQEERGRAIRQPDRLIGDRRIRE